MKELAEQLLNLERGAEFNKVEKKLRAIAGPNERYIRVGNKYVRLHRGRGISILRVV